MTFNREKKKSGNKILIPETVRYICKYCEKEFFESKKLKMLQGGEWRPQAVPDDPLRRSYHSPGLISPFLDWERICKQYVKSDFGRDLPIFKDFTINYLGNAWFNREKSAKWEDLKARSDNYIMGTVPKGIDVNVSGFTVNDGGLVLFSGVDVQKDRLELCTTSFGINGNKWIVDYKIFYGDTKNIDDP
ncbi:MAG: hypothetical protein GY799_04540, partial [Desulfobulbaceae bacterium]|nr:hypothetical protein [Desulfobulbaceae bacterium]